MTVMQIVSAVAGGLSALCWLRAALIRTPANFDVGFGGVGGSAQTLAEALVRQSRWNALGAILAALSVGTQAWLTLNI